LLIRQTTESAVTEILLVGVNPILLLPLKSLLIPRLSYESSEEYGAITAANANADDPLAVTDAADAAETTATCPIAQDNARIATRFARKFNIAFMRVSLTCSAGNSGQLRLTDAILRRALFCRVDRIDRYEAG
jgi:hypothetical protein